MKSDTEAKWAARVAEWRASGTKANEFAEGRSFRGSTLTHWASRLRHGALKRPPQKAVRLARVVRSAIVAVPVAAPSRGMTVEVGVVRVVVQRGFDGALLREVIAALRDER